MTSFAQRDALFFSAEKKKKILGHDPADYLSSKWAGLKLPDMSRPAFMVPSVAELVRNRKCPTCKKDICPKDFDPWAALQRAEYSISGMCSKCQSGVFGDNTAPKAHPVDVKSCDRFTRWDKSAEEVQAHREKRDAPAVSQGTITSQPHFGFGAGTRWFKCSLHGKKAVECIENMDKYETWRCKECGVCSTIRCRHFAGFYGGEI